MRKRLLRSRSGFEKPESREEAIMQNILGASNVLEPAESNIEEILQAILYNTPYTKEAEFEIEKILLAIKNNGTYDGEGESRDMKILIAILKDLDYTEEAESRIEELFIEWLQQRQQIKVLEGVPPLAFTAQGQPLINLTIYGASGGVGDKTANLFDENETADIIDNKYINPGGTLITNNGYYISYPISVEPNSVYTWQFDSDGHTLHTSPTVGFYDSSKNLISAAAHDISIRYFSFTTPSNCKYVRASVFKRYKNEAMLNSGGTSLPYEPYGYKIQISCGGETNTIYLDTPLYDGNSISMADTGIEIPTINGQNTLAVDTTVQPEKVYIEYK